MEAASEEKNVVSASTTTADQPSHKTENGAVIEESEPAAAAAPAGGTNTAISSSQEEPTSLSAVEIDRSIKSHLGETPVNSAPDATSERQRNKTRKTTSQHATVYGIPTTVTSSGTFPSIGSVLGPYFCLGRLGKGTFSSIHKCVNLQYFHNNNNNPQEASRRRLAAAKVELSDFQQSGVLEAEATMLDFLHRSLPAGTVPVYMGHYRCSQYAALFMEYLPGPDMHQLREQVMAITKQAAAAQQPQQQYNTRRLATRDAVMLSAHVLLPLLQRMHQVGTVHRDVKPSNIVQSHVSNNRQKTAKDFCLVDFGLSKSIVVPATSDYADQEHLWPIDKQWLKPLHYNGHAAYRKERKKADFRGTSMYASLRVHQGKDYCPRDDIWSLLYVFCDLLTGGLPWMSYAANRDRAACQKFKERVHGDAEGSQDETALLLYGDEYHVAAYKRERQLEHGVEEEKLTQLPEPLAMSKDKFKVGRLREAFKHVAQLRFFDMPDYDLIKNCIEDFLRPNESSLVEPDIPEIPWISRPKSPENNRRKRGYPEWCFDDLQDKDPLEEDVFDDVEAENRSQPRRSFVSRFPVYYQFQLAQMRQNAEETPPHIALHDWLCVVLRLLHKEWNARKYEEGGHRTSTDGFRRDRYLELVQECLTYAEKHNYFMSQDYYQLKEEASTNGDSTVPPSLKKRKVVLRDVRGSYKENPVVFVSETVYILQEAIKAEKAKKPPPPVRLSFS